MRVSIIIVSYHVQAFLEQCLHSLRRSSQRAHTEVIVVDNDPADGSTAYLQPRFPEVRFADAGGNVGFGRACNHGLALATGEYILFLNPDTLLAEDTIEQSLKQFETHPQCGALGVRMVDGGGRFLKESKRAFPSPLTSLFKLTGMATLFPRSKTFARYHLGHLPEHEDAPVDVLAGAYMMMPRRVLDEVGAFDEAFFMYGEDVDLSYRVQAAGYQNWYLAGATIVHFKGESTKRGSLNYVRLFYKAMLTFVDKHYGGARAAVFRRCIQAAILLRAALAALGNALRRMGLPLVDALLIALTFAAVTQAWQVWVKPDTKYATNLLLYAIPAFTGTFLLAAYYAGLYNPQYHRRHLYRSMAVSVAVVLAVYALLPEGLRFSRGIVAVGSLSAFTVISLLRWGLLRSGAIVQERDERTEGYIWLVGTERDKASAEALLVAAGLSDTVLGSLRADELTAAHNRDSLASFGRQTEVVLCTPGLSYAAAIGAAADWGRRVRLRFHAAGSGSMVGSDESRTSGDVRTGQAAYRIARPEQRRLKRAVDVLFSLFLFLLTPFVFLLHKRGGRLLRGAGRVLIAKATWVGYSASSTGLPPLRPAIADPQGALHTTGKAPSDLQSRLQRYYATHYTVWKDLRAMGRVLGEQPGKTDEQLNR